MKKENINSNIKNSPNHCVKKKDLITNYAQFSMPLKRYLFLILLTSFLASCNMHATFSSGVKLYYSISSDSVVYTTTNSQCLAISDNKKDTLGEMWGELTLPDGGVGWAKENSYQKARGKCGK